ncbi:DNA polymerase III subunit alpha [Orientia tsutsugamushi]|uniref:DNA polymerase III subunit alpha n=1 Tax=Orientia tsutsugamushi TaxID=784 RepID=A0A2R8F3U6_ORITS|nr:DNA polymerase III subunit alpha [Orientia tsutsugamushi]SPM46110.1 DNA polymerase III subunit alpha [Orientia tsutsugamushi]
MNAKFIHLRVQSSYSLLESTLSTQKILSLAQRYEMPAVALTDKSNLFGSLEFALAAAKEGIQAIHGIILNIQYYGQNDSPKYSEILLIAQNKAGYQNLLKLASFPYIKNDRTTINHVTLDDLFTYNEGIIVLSGYFYGIIGNLLFEKNFVLAENYAKKFKTIFGNRFYFEINRITSKQIYAIEKSYVQLAQKLNIPLVATNNILFDEGEKYATHEVLMKICNPNIEIDKFKINNQCYFKSQNEMIETFWDLPQAIENTVYLTQRISFMLEAKKPLLPKFAKDADEENKLIRQLSEEGLSQKLKLQFKNYSTAEFEDKKKIYFDRLNYELSVICSMNFSGYFLIVSDFIKWSKENNISVNPRGSGAASVVAWGLGITNLDPIRFGLLFERFLNPERVSMPDFDIDFCQERRGEVINYVRRKYGEGKVGQIITFGKLQAKAVVKDVARALGLGYNYANYITSLIPFNAVRPVTLQEAIDKVNELNNAYTGNDLYNFESLINVDTRYLKLLDKWQSKNYIKIQQILNNINIKDEQLNLIKELDNKQDIQDYIDIIKSESTYQKVISCCQKLNLDSLASEFQQMHDEYQDLISNRKAQIQDVIKTALELEGLHRHVSVHAAGIVIGRQNLIDTIALYKDKNSEIPVVQYSMKYLEAAGLIKFDFLGLQTLTIISKCLELLKNKNINFEINNLEFNDKLTYKLLSSGNTIGVFQFESSGMQDALKRLKPDCIEDLIALGALYRPGPMDNLRTYIDCKHGRLQPNYLHSKLEPILKETYGTIIYQEQVMEIARVLAKYTLSKADFLRQAMAKKIKSEMENQKVIFINGAIENGISKNQAESIFAEVEKFAGYGFNKSHAAIYAVISYQTAYLKANYPTEFLVACLNLDINDQDKIDLFIQEAKQLGIKVIPPNINKSKEYFSMSADNAIIFALGAIKNVTPNIGKIIVEERLHRGEFKTILDFAVRTDSYSISRKVFESLIYAGCFDDFQQPVNRHQLFASIDRINNYASKHAKHIHQFSFITSTVEDVLIPISEYSLHEKAMKEFEVLGSFLTCNPIAPYESLLAKHGVINSKYLSTTLKSGSTAVKIAGIVQKKNSRMSPRGKFNIIKLSDSCGNSEVKIFDEEILRKYSSLLEIGSLVIAQCDVFKDEGGIRIVATEFKDIETIKNDLDKHLQLTINHEQDLDEVINVITSTNITKGDTEIDMTLPFFNKKFQVIVTIKLKYSLTIDQLINLNKFIS